MSRKHTPSYYKDEATGEIRVRPRQKLLERLSPSVGRSQALRDIHEKLAIATELFDHHGDGGRCGVYRAMLDVVDYFADLGIPRATLKPLSAVAGAIVDADRGTDSAIFRPDRGPRSGKPPASVSQLEFEGHLVTVTECCVRHCKMQRQRPYIAPACTLAAKMVNESIWPVKVTATQMRELRERVQQGARTSPDRILLEHVMLSSEVAKTYPLAWAKLLLEHDWVGPPPSELSA